MSKAISVPRLGWPDCLPALPVGHLASPTCVLIRINYQCQGTPPSEQFCSPGAVGCSIWRMVTGRGLGFGSANAEGGCQERGSVMSGDTCTTVTPRASGVMGPCPL